MFNLLLTLLISPLRSAVSNPAPIDLTSPPLSENRLSNIPVAVIASNRPYYLFRSLRSMLSAHGAKKELFTVFIDGFFEEPAAVAQLFGIKSVQHGPISTATARISQVCINMPQSRARSIDSFRKRENTETLEEAFG